MIKKWLQWLEEHTFGWLVNTIFNIGYWIKHRNDWKITKSQMKSFKNKIESIDDAESFMNNFEWRAEKIDWTPWTITAVHMYMTGVFDDCDGAAVLWKWLFEICGYKATIWRLRGDSGHAVTITEDKQYMGTNNTLYKFNNPDDWKKEMLEVYFDNKYDFIFH